MIEVPVALVVHFNQLFLESLLQCLNFLLMLSLQLLYLFRIDFTSLCLLSTLLGISFLLLLAKYLNVLNQRGHWILLSTLLGLGYTLVHCVHQKCWVLYLRLNDRPQLFNQKAQTTALLFGLLQFLIKQFLTVLKQLYQLLVLRLELLDLVDVSLLLFNLFVDNVLLLG